MGLSPQTEIVLDDAAKNDLASLGHFTKVRTELRKNIKEHFRNYYENSRSRSRE